MKGSCLLMQTSFPRTERLSGYCKQSCKMQMPPSSSSPHWDTTTAPDYCSKYWELALVLHFDLPFPTCRALISPRCPPRLEWMISPWLTFTWPCRPQQERTLARTTTATNWQPVHRACRRLWKVGQGFFLPVVMCTLSNSKEFLKE